MKTQESFQLEINKTRADVLTAVFMTSLKNEDFVNLFHSFGTEEEVTELGKMVEELSNGIHILGWCNDEECTHNRKAFKKISTS